MSDCDGGCVFRRLDDALEDVRMLRNLLALSPFSGRLGFRGDPPPPPPPRPRKLSVAEMLVPRQRKGPGSSHLRYPLPQRRPPR